MAIGIDQIYLSMTDPDTGNYLTANIYTDVLDRCKLAASEVVAAQLKQKD